VAFCPGGLLSVWSFVRWFFVRWSFVRDSCSVFCRLHTVALCCFQISTIQHRSLLTDMLHLLYLSTKTTCVCWLVSPSISSLPSFILCSESCQLLLSCANDWHWMLTVILTAIVLQCTVSHMTCMQSVNSGLHQCFSCISLVCYFRHLSCRCLTVIRATNIFGWSKATLLEDLRLQLLLWAFSAQSGSKV